MPAKLLRSRRTSLISPLIDVVLGAFLALLVIFSAFLILSRDCEGRPEPLRFLREVEPPPAIQGQSYSFIFPVAGGSGNRRFELEGELPERLGFDRESGTIYGFIEAVVGKGLAEFPLRVKVSDARGDHDETAANLLVYPSAVPYDPQQPAFEILAKARELPVGRVGRPYSAVIGAVGGVEPYEWSASGLPTGLRVEKGMLEGTPRQPGEFGVKVKSLHSPGRFRFRDRLHTWKGGRAEQDLSLRVLPTFQVKGHFPMGRVGQPFLGGLGVNGLLSDEKVVWEGVPPGLRPSESGLLLLGEPTKAGAYPVSFRVVGGGESLAQGEGEIRISPPVQPSLGPVTLQVWRGEPTRQLLPARGFEEPIRFIVTGALPPGLKIEDGYLVGTCEVVGLTTVGIAAVDGLGRVIQDEISIRVGPRF